MGWCSSGSWSASATPCAICSDVERDGATVLVVEGPRDLEAVERAGCFGGHYVVLHGALHPAEGTEAKDLGTERLFARLASGAVRVGRTSSRVSKPWFSTRKSSRPSSMIHRKRLLMPIESLTLSVEGIEVE